MTIICELPAVGEVKWVDAERDTVEVDGFTYGDHYLNSIVDDVRHSLARLLAVQEFIASEREESRLDCAGELAYNTCYGYGQSVGSDLWGHLPESSRKHWIGIAKAVLDGEH